MSLLTPVKVPVKVYRWDDVGAPQLDKTAGCMMTIFKACLVTGYGTKESAGWTMPFGDTSTGVKVLRPEIGPHTDFYLRLSADTGTEMAAQVYLNMTDANTGDLKLQCATGFRYGKRSPCNKWILVATPRNLWFFNEGGTVKSGCYFFCGDLIADQSERSCVYIEHTGGTSTSGSVYKGIASLVAIGSSNSVEGKALYNDVVYSARLASMFDGTGNLSASAVGASLYITVGGNLFACAGVLTSAQSGLLDNFTSVTLLDADKIIESVAFGSASDTGSIYILIDNWSG